MSAVPKKLLTPDEYLEIERRAEFKSEFYNGEMFAIASTGFAHNAIKTNLIVEIGCQLRDSSCRTLSTTQRVLVEPVGFYTYPDILIYCGRPEFDPRGPDTLVNPRVVIEVLSDPTEGYDRGKKFHRYIEMPCLEEYVLVSSDEVSIFRFSRTNGTDWNLTLFTDPGDEFSLTSVPVKFPLKDAYAGVELPPAA